MVDFTTREGIMLEWDKWRKYIASGGGGTWPRDAFESLLDYFYDQISQASAKPSGTDYRDVCDGYGGDCGQGEKCSLECFEPRPRF